MRNPFKRTPWEDREVTLHVLTRHFLDKKEDGQPDEDGGFEYHDRVRTMPYRKLPVNAVHITGRKDEYALVEMEPRFPPYCLAQRDAQGNPKKAFNYFDAHGYHTYAVDNRLKEAEDELGRMHRVKTPLEWQKIVTVVAVVAVVAFVVWRFVA